MDAPIDTYPDPGDGDLHVPNAERWDEVPCRKCGKLWWRTRWQAHAYVRLCKQCKYAYKVELKFRRERGETVAGPDCPVCGKPTRRNSKDGVHMFCRWVRRKDEIEEEKVVAAETAAEELKNPTKEETWLKVARTRLSEARRRVRDASPSPMGGSRRARSSPSS